MTRLLARTISSIAPLLALACGGDGKRTYQEVSLAANESFCRFAHECRAEYPQGADLTFEERYATDAETCFDDVLVRLAESRWFEQIEASRDAGRIVVNVDAGEECLDGVLALACTPFFDYDWPLVCDDVVNGTVAAGQACNWDLECADYPNVYCDVTCQPAL